jgi:hypothetical protein
MDDRILLVDNKYDPDDSLMRLLQGSGYTVLTAAEAGHVPGGRIGRPKARPLRSLAEYLARELLHRVGLLATCLELPTVTDSERQLWRDRIGDSYRRLDELYAGGLRRDFLREPMGPSRQSQGDVARTE